MNLLNIFEKIVLSSLIGSVIVLIILITKVIFKNKLNFTFHYYIWLILLIKLIVPFGPQTPFNISNLFENSYLQSATNKNIQHLKINQLEKINLRDSTIKNTLQLSNESIINNTILLPLISKTNIEKTLCFTWIFGIILLTGILLAGHKKLKDIVSSSTKYITTAHREIFNKCVEAMNIRTQVELSYSKKISSPSLCGLTKPKILIPISIADNIYDEEFKYIIMHELTHLKSKDIFINWAITLLSMIYWFNPIILYGFHKMRQDCEMSCDGQVISYLGVGENLKYGNAIIKVLELGGNSSRLTGTTSMVLNSLEIKRRIIMISKYRKINIKSILLGVLIVVIIGGLGIAINTSSISSDKKIAKAISLQVETPVTPSKVTNTSNAASSTNIKKLSNASSNSIVPFSADIVVYNSHPDEDYASGMKITDVGALINDKLVKEGFNSRFIRITQNTDYNKSYQISRNLLTKDIKSFSNTILLDIHRDITKKDKSSARKMLFILTQKNPRYESNKRFVDSLIGNIKNSNGVESGIYFYQYGISYFNQDLSNTSALINFGNNMSSDSDIEACVATLVSALKNTKGVSPN